MKQNNFSFCFATTALVSIYAVAAAPIPLYRHYAELFRLSNGDLALTAVAYFLGTMLSLLVFARLSDHLGRKPVALAALLLALLSCVGFARANGLALIIAGRIAQGVACGMASSALAALMLDSLPAHRQAFGATLGGASPLLGLTFGAFLSSGLVSAFGSYDLAYFVLTVIFTLLIMALFFVRESVAKQAVGFSVFVPKISLPNELRPVLPVAMMVFAVSWALGGFSQAFSAKLASHFGFQASLAAASVFCGFMSANFLGGLSAAKRAEYPVQFYGTIGYILTAALLVYGVARQQFTAFVFGGIGAGFFSGAIFNGAIRACLAKADKRQSAVVFAFVFLVAYAGAGVPNLLIAYFAPKADLVSLLTGYLVLITGIGLAILWKLKAKRA